jgi:hypothetical protein
MELGRGAGRGELSNVRFQTGGIQEAYNKNYKHLLREGGTGENSGLVKSVSV